MISDKKVGIWMDHAVAHLIEANAPQKRRLIESDFTFEVKEEALSRSENLMHNKRQQMIEAYYKELATVILGYDHVLLFGPTNANLELNNYLRKDLKYKDILIDVLPADKMTDNQLFAFVRDYFD